MSIPLQPGDRVRVTIDTGMPTSTRYAFTVPAGPSHPAAHVEVVERSASTDPILILADELAAGDERDQALALGLRALAAEDAAGFTDDEPPSVGAEWPGPTSERVAEAVRTALADDGTKSDTVEQRVMAAVMPAVAGLLSSYRNVHLLLRAREAQAFELVEERNAAAAIAVELISRADTLLRLAGTEGHPATLYPAVDQRTANDCLRACVATLYGCDYEDAPDLVASPAWRDELRAWARERDGDFRFTTPEAAPPYHFAGEQRIGSGPSPRGDFSHAVIIAAADLAVVHDPHASRAGLPGGVAEVISWCAPYDPAPASPRQYGIDDRVVLATDEAHEYPGTVDHIGADGRHGVLWDHLAAVEYYAGEDLTPTDPLHATQQGDTDVQAH